MLIPKQWGGAVKAMALRAACGRPWLRPIGWCSPRLSASRVWFWRADRSPG